MKRFVAGLMLAAFSILAAVPVSAQSLGDTFENGIVNALRGTALTIPATLYVGLSTAACSDSGVGTEVSGGSYARVAVTTGTGAWAATNGTNGITSNVAAITFPAPTANWGTVTHWFIADASTAGNVYVCAALTSSRTINNGDGAPSFAIGALTITISKAPVLPGVPLIAANDERFHAIRRVTALAA
jgi:hypothetical protein